ncbi:MAG: hypothetical protein HPY64_12635 [Anaerolineae bacterium]|nr:hypothetical protein [Anaerolineae bacterium]
MNHLFHWTVIAALSVAGIAVAPVLASTIPPPSSAATAMQSGCHPQGMIVTQPIVDPLRFCPEYLVNNLPYSALAAITSIAYAPACDEMTGPVAWCGRLFMTRPDEGLVQWIGDFDQDAGTYTLHIFASGLDTPNGLAWHEGGWYVSGDRTIYRLIDDDGDGHADVQQTIIEGLPGGSGLWTGSIGFGPDGRLYVSKGAACSTCVESDPRRATLLSYSSDGSDERVVARGLYDAFDFAWHPGSGDLWIADSAPAPGGSTSEQPLDELNRLTEGGQHFGWPYCAASASGLLADFPLPAPQPDFCQRIALPEYTFPAYSTPGGMTFYRGEAFPDFQDDLLIVLRGSTAGYLPTGYALYRFCFDSRGRAEPCQDATGNLIRDETGQPSVRELLVPVDVYYGYPLEIMTIQGQSFYPEHPVDVAVSSEGYIAVSILEGRIIRLLPGSGR